jgi:benzoylsuccinyl-CoA thiolase BbsA subunit
MLEGKVRSFKCEEEVELTIGPIRMNRDGLPITSYKFKKASG